MPKSSNRGAQSNILVDDTHLDKEGKKVIQVCGYGSQSSQTPLAPVLFHQTEAARS